MRRAAFVGAMIGVGLTLALKVVHLIGGIRIPVLDGLLLRPGELATWLFVLGDVGTPLQNAVWPMLLACLINGTAGAIIALLIEISHCSVQRHR